MKIRPLLLVLAACSPSIVAAEPKKIIVCTVTTGFRHSSIPYAEKTLQKLADESKAYTVVDWVQQPSVKVPQPPSKPKDLKPDANDEAKAKHAAELAKYEADMLKWNAEEKTKAAEAQKAFDAEMTAQMAKLAPDRLAKVDAVIFANTTGDLPLPDKEGFIKWIQGGGAFIAMHSGSDTFHGFKPFLDMLQGEFNGHGAQVPADLVVADSQHPATQGLPNPWPIKQEEMYLIKNHDRAKLRSLLYMKHHPNKREELGYFPVAWGRMEGKGRVFYTSLGHREDLWSDDPALKDRINPVETSQKFQQHILGGIKWAVGLADGSTEPIAELP
jgi:type 1 glutamine amidotransferase